MKKYISFRVFVAAVLLLIGNSCDKSLDVPAYAPYARSTTDATGGAWKTILLQNSDELTVPMPEAISSATYQAELQALKTVRSQITDAQKEKVYHWGAGAVLRWNEIARELAALYNVPPNNNPDGTYPIPDPAHPTQYPRFPFANPPYAARMFALLSVAQYDALVTAWNYKFKYNRQAPGKQDATLQSLLPASDLPSYPSEDAVIAAASREVLKAMFPGEAGMLTQKADEHKNSRLWAGANVKSDLDAGEELGKLVAQRVLAYAKADNMSKANTQAEVPKLRESATSRGLTHQWMSMDIPARPPMLPLYGNVKLWNMDEQTKVAIRPEAPPAPGSPEFEKELQELRQMSKNRTREQFKIASYWADGVGSYTPPGHWNRKAADLLYESRWSELRAARVMALLNTALQDAGVCCWDTKFYYLSRRPSHVDPDIKTSTGLPNFPGYTSGHSTFSAAAASVLSYAFPAQKAELQAMAKEASESRIYGGIHFRSDCEAGLRCGTKIGEFAVARGKNDRSGL